jgi:hypothetical protein
MHDDSISALERWFVAAALHYVAQVDIPDRTRVEKLRPSTEASRMPASLRRVSVQVRVSKRVVGK